MIFTVSVSTHLKIVYSKHFLANVPFLYQSPSFIRSTENIFASSWFPVGSKGENG